MIICYRLTKSINRVQFDSLLIIKLTTQKAEDTNAYLFKLMTTYKLINECRRISEQNGVNAIIKIQILNMYLFSLKDLSLSEFKPLCYRHLASP